MTMQSTSLEAYEEVKKTLSKKQITVFNALKQYNSRTFTNTELAECLGWPINTVTPRIFELRQKSLVKEGCKRRCGITHRTAIAWRIKRADEITERQMELRL